MVSKNETAKKRASDDDLHFLAQCLDHPQEEVAQVLHLIYQRMATKSAGILFKFMLDIQIEMKQK